MIRHMVLFNLKPEIPDSERDELLASIRDLGNLPSVGLIQTGRLLDPRKPDYRNHMTRDFEYALLADFDDEDALYAYQRAPAHVTVAQEIRKRVSAITVFDFVVGD